MSACLALRFGPLVDALFRGSDRLYHTTTKEFAVVRCGECGLLRLDPQPPPEELRALLSGQLLVRAGQSAASRWRRRTGGWCCATMCGFVARALRQLAARRAAARRGLRRRAVSGHAAGARLPRARTGLLARGRGHRLAPAAGARGLRVARAGAASAPGSVAGLTMFHVLEHLYDPRAYLAAALALLRPGRAAGRAGAERGMLAVPPAGPRRGTAWMCRGICTISATAIWRSCWNRAASKCCGANISRCATIPRAWPAVWRPRSIPWRGASARIPKRPACRLVKDLLYLALVAASLPFTAAGGGVPRRLHRDDRGAARR